VKGAGVHVGQEHTEAPTGNAEVKEASIVTSYLADPVGKGRDGVGVSGQVTWESVFFYSTRV
jgi:hypothetical protein